MSKSLDLSVERTSRRGRSWGPQELHPVASVNPRCEWCFASPSARTGCVGRPRISEAASHSELSIPSHHSPLKLASLRLPSWVGGGPRSPTLSLCGGSSSPDARALDRRIRLRSFAWTRRRSASGCTRCVRAVTSSPITSSSATSFWTRSVADCTGLNGKVDTTFIERSLLAGK